ncbi:MAG: LamG domain-containing protein, partial [Elusimicrobia bacterium]|nr:LamG domain-containing protein [Elusimicrobiota bacterium]
MAKPLGTVLFCVLCVRRLADFAFFAVPVQAGKRIKTIFILIFVGIYITFYIPCYASYQHGAYQTDGTASATTNRSRYMAMTSPDKDNMKVIKFGHKSNVAGTFRMALYVGGSAGNPDGATKVYDSGQLTHGGGDWEEFDFSTPYNLAKNTQFGIAWKTDGSSYYYASGGTLENCDQYWDNLLNEPADSSQVFVDTLDVDATYDYTYLHYIVYVLYPTIDSISDDTIAPSQTGVQVNGTGFEMDNEFGNNANKLYLGNAATWAGCTTTVEQLVTEWSNTQVTFTVNKGGLSFGTAYVYIKNDDSEINTNGFTVTLVDETPPPPPKETKRIKTVEYSFGGYYSDTDVGAGSAWTPSPITVYLPEDDIVIKNAFLEFSCWIDDGDVTSLSIRFDQGSSASTVRYSATGTLSYDTGEHRRGHVIADVTSAIASASSQQYAASVTVGDATNMNTLKLYITYEYNANSATQVKTVRFPIYSVMNSSIAARTSEATEGGAWQTYAFTYNANIAESTDTVNLRQQWFEVRGWRRYGSSNHTGRMRVNINGGTASSEMYFDSSDETSYDCFFLSDSDPSHAAYGNFALNNSQTLNVQICNEDSSTDPAQLVLCGEVVLTYEYSNSAPTKTKTVRYFLGQGTSADGSYYFEDNIYLNENNITIKRIYAQVYGSYSNNSSGNISIDSRIGSTQEMSQRSYSLYAQDPNTSGFSFFHDMTEEAGDWSDGEVVRLTIGGLTDLGGCGAELIITYDYTNEGSYTDYYQIYAGQSSAWVATGNTDSHGFDIFHPVSTPAGAKDLRSAWLLMKFEQTVNSYITTADPSTSIDIDSSNSQAVAHRTQTDTHGGYVLYGNQGQITINMSSATANYSISADGASFCGKCHIVYERTPPPYEPYGLTQYKSDATTELLPGQWTNETTMNFVMVSSSPLTSDSLKTEIEIRPLGTDFTDTANYIDDESLSYSGTPVVSTITVVGLAGNTTYHWQARVKGDVDYSEWVSYGNNPEDNVDFGMDQTDPYMTNNMSGGDNTWRRVDAGAVYNVDFFDDHSGLDYTQYRINDGEAGTGNWLTDWTSIPGVSGKSFANEWSINFSTCVPGYNYVSLKIYDNTGRDYSANDVFYVKKDTVAPVITDGQDGDDAWRKDPGIAYNVDFTDNLSLLDTAEYTIFSSSGMDGTQLKTWTSIFSSLGSASYTTDWEIDFDICESTYNYISVRCWDICGTTSTFVDIFHVKKDTIPPTMPGLTSPADTVVLNYSTVSFTWSASVDDLSGIDNYELQVDDDIDFLSLAYSTVTTLTQSTSTFLSDGGYYWRVRSKDTIGNYSDWSSTRSFRIDNVDPVFQGNFASKRADSTWVGESEWNDNSSPDVRIQVQDTDSGLRVTKSSYTSDSNTVLLMHFDEGGGLPQDESSYGNHAVSNNASWTTDTAPVIDSSYALDFNGSSNYVDCGQDSSFDFDYFTVEAWVKFGSTSGNRVIASIDDGTNRRWALYLLNGNTLRFFVFNNNSWVSPDYSWVPATDTWYHIVGVKGDYVRTYINGHEVGTAQYQPGATDKDAMDLRIGRGSYPGWFDGIIDEVRILDRALTSEEVEASYTLGSIKYSTDGGSTWVPLYAGISGQNGTNVIEISSAVSISLQESASQNKIKFYVNDMAGNITESGIYNVKIDTAPPSIPSLVSPSEDDIFNTSEISFDWNDSDDNTSGIDSYIMEVSSFIDFSLVYYSSQPTGSQLSASLSTGKYWWRLRAKDVCGNYGDYSSTGSFIVDLTTPSINVYQTGDDIWRTSNNGTYNIDFSDDYLLDKFEIKASTGGADLTSWTLVESTQTKEYTEDWSLPESVWDALISGQDENYISIRVSDLAGNTSTYADAFYVMKDTISPEVTDNQTGDDVWRKTGGASYNIDFTDSGGSLLSEFETKITTGPDQTGQLIQDWTSIASGIDASTYTDDWQLESTAFDSMWSGKNYVHVRVWDVAGLTTTYNNAFYVLKDTTPPSVSAWQTGDDAWRKTGGTAYNVDFHDQSELDYAQYTIWTSSGRSGVQLKDWTNIFNPGYGSTVYDSDWQIDFSTCVEGYNYISVRVYDIAGSSATEEDVFYVKKDVSSPQISDGQLGDDTWRRVDGTTYNINFADAGGSLLDYAEYSVFTGLGQTGSHVIDWTDIFTGLGGSTYTDDWSVDFDSLWAGINRVSVRVYDNAGNPGTLDDVFYIKKDTEPPSVSDYQDGDDTWRSGEGTTYN